MLPERSGPMTTRELVVLGTSSQVPTRDRNHNGHLLRWDDEAVLFDPGEGTQRQLVLAGVPSSAITRICVTHFHGDHCLGLPGVVQRLSLDRVAHPVEVYYPASGQRWFERLRSACSFVEAVELRPHPVGAEGVVAPAPPFDLVARRLDHVPETFGWRLEEPDGRRMLPERLAALGVRGPDVGRLRREGAIWAGGVDGLGRRVTLEEASAVRRGQRMAFVMDTRLCEAAFALAEGVVLVDVARAGVNFADTHQAEDTYLARRRLPFVPGLEAVGATPDGQRVAALLSGGGYAEKVTVARSLAFPVPDAVGDGAALAVVLQGLTAWHLLRTSARLQAGESVVVHAAAGGVGTLAVQLARRFGAGRVIATASTEDKRALALELGADATVDPAGDLRAALVDANQGKEVDVVLEMTGGRVFDQSLAALAPFGRLVFYGMASRQAPEPVSPPQLMRTSRGVVGFWLVNCLRRPEMLAPPVRELLAMTAAGDLRPVVGATYPLSQVRRAHEDLRARRTTGKLLLDPSA